jgi:hypothetical protein
LRSEKGDLEPIQGDQVRDVLKRLKSGKAKGMDGWTPMELEALAPQWTDQLARFYNRWEQQGAWPPTIRNAVIALIEKPGAKSEAQLRPIGILLYIYRIWMAIRKKQARGWSLRLHGGEHSGAGRRHGVPVQGPH